MRWIQKQPGQPACIEEFVAIQLEARERESAISGKDEWDQFKLNYPSMNSKRLRELLIEEQFGLCAYTGAAIDDERSPKPSSSSQPPTRKGSPHIEHLKSQHQCKGELESGGKTYGKDRGEDIDYHNMVAAIEIRGKESELFGAVARKNDPLPIWPTHQDCESAFTYFLDGTIRGITGPALETARLLRLGHGTLIDWRAEKINEWFGLPSEDTFPVQGMDDEGADSMPTPEQLPASRLREIIAAMETPAVGDKLPEFAFVIAQIARDALAIQKKIQVEPA
jgi:hypothetical protein